LIRIRGTAVEINTDTATIVEARAELRKQAIEVGFLKELV
jgi:hypothetical protein